jgi:O-antigen ligase
MLAFVIGSFAPSSPEVQIVSQRARSIVGERNPYDDRPNIWAEGRRETLDDPWTGQGPGSFPIVAARSGSQTVTFYPEHAHNLLLTFAAEIGLPGVVFALGFVVAVGSKVRTALRRARAAGRHRDAALVACLAAAMVAILAQGLIDYSLRSAVIFTTVTGVLGALLAMTRILSK